MTADQMATHVEQIYGQHIRDVGRRSHMLASDYVIEEAWQSVLLAVWQKWAAGELYVSEDSNLAGLLCNWFVRNLSFKESNAIALRSGVQMDEQWWVAEAKRNTGAVMCMSEASTLYGEVVETLKPWELRVLELRAEGFRYNAIGSMLGMTERSAGNIAYQGRKRVEKLKQSAVG